MCHRFLDVIIFVCVMKPSAFHSLCTIPLISATVDIRNTILRNCRRGSLERWGDDRKRGGRGGGVGAGVEAGEEKESKKERKKSMAGSDCKCRWL